MSVIQAILLGLIQGVTEFLPVSSSAHLILFREFLQVKDSQIVFENVCFHFAALLAVFLLFFREWKRLWKAFLGILSDGWYNCRILLSGKQRNEKTYRKLLTTNYRKICWWLFLTMIPTAGIGMIILPLVDMMSTNLLAPGIGLYLTAILLLVTDMLPKEPKSRKELKGRDALITGLFQGFSSIPGLSRLGSTMSACMIGGMSRSFAVKYSIFASVPTILGAMLLELTKLGKDGLVFRPVYLAGMASAALTAVVAIRFLLQVTRNGKLKIFSIYCLLAGTISIAGYFLF